MILQGLTIEGGRAVGNEAGENEGGAIRASLTGEASNEFQVLQCVLRNNEAVSLGGGLYFYRGNQGTIVLRRTVFEGNALTPLAGDGAGAWIDSNASPPHAPVTVAECSFLGNSINGDSSGRGGGLHVDSASSITIANCSFVGNEIAYPAAAGAGMYVGVAATIMNSLFAGNVIAPGNGSEGGSVLGAVSLEVFNCTVVKGEAHQTGGILAKGTLDVFNSIAVLNEDSYGGLSAQLKSEITNGLEIHYSCVEDISVGFTDNNVDTNPDFVDADGGNYRLKGLSPLISKGSDALIALDLADLDGDLSTAEDVPWSLFDPGSTAVAREICVVEMGAYERSTLCPLDLNDDGCVSGAEITAVLGDWCPSCGCTSPADLNCDGCVDGEDIAMILGNWGQCSGSSMSCDPLPEEFRGGGCIATPQAAAEVFGFETVEELAEWLASLDEATMFDLLTGLFCE